jgi:hypothetical protein
MVTRCYAIFEFLSPSSRSELWLFSAGLCVFTSYRTSCRVLLLRRTQRMEPVETPLDLTSAVSQCLASDKYAEGLNLLALSLHQVAEAARILKEGARGIEAARVSNMLSVAAKQAQGLLSEEPVETPLDLSSAVSQFWKAHDDALFPQPVLTAITGLLAVYFERGRWAGYGPKFLKLGRLVRYRKADVVDWIN